MKKILMILFSTVLLFNTYFSLPLITKAANYDYDNSALVNYPGYLEAMKEAIIKHAYYVGGAAVDAHQFVTETAVEVIEYGKKTINENEFLNFLATHNGPYVMFNLIKDIFDSFARENGDVEENNVSVPSNDYTSIAKAFSKDSTYSNMLRVNVGYKVTLIYPDGTSQDLKSGDSISISLMGAHYQDGDRWQNESYYQLRLNNVYGSKIYMSSANWMAYYNRTDKESINVLLNELFFGGGSLLIEFNGSRLDIPDYTPKPRPINIINNYYKENSPELPMPKPKPILSCENGIELNVIVDGSKFLDDTGKEMAISTDGKFVKDGSECSLNWIVPNIFYDDNGNVVMENPDGNIGTDPGAGCNDILCFLGSLLSSIADIAKALLNLIGDLTKLLVSLFVPSDPSFITDNFESANNLFGEKFGALGDVKDELSGMFEENESVLDEMYLDLPIMSEPVKLMDFEIVGIGVPYLKRFISGILVIVTLLFVYRKIVGSGGIMEK